MYVIDGSDRVIALGDVPVPDSGAPLPFIMSDEQVLLLAYLTDDLDCQTGATSVRMMTPDSEARVALVEFHRPFAHMFGPPSDETFAGHPLASRGLHPYGVFEVEASSWVRQLEKMSRLPGHKSPLCRSERRHFIFSFHDSTFECVAESIIATRREGSVRDAMFEMLQRVQGS